MKTFLKTTFRMYLSNWSRFLAYFLVVFISIALCSGLGGLSPIYKRSMEDLYNKTNINQITIKCKTSSGFTSSDVEKLSSISEIKNTSLSYVNDYKQKDTNKDSSKEYIYRVSIIDFKENRLSNGVNKLQLDNSSSHYIQTDNQILIKTPNQNLINYQINESINLDLLSTGVSLMNKKYTICGYVKDSYYSCVMPEVSYLNENDSQDLKVDCFVYLDSNKLNSIQASLLPKTDLNISLNNPYSFFDKDNYFNYVNNIVDKLKNIFGEENYAYLTLNENTSFKMFDEYMDKISVISYIFPVSLYFTIITSESLSTSTFPLPTRFSNSFNIKSLLNSCASFSNIAAAVAIPIKSFSFPTVLDVLAFIALVISPLSPPSIEIDTPANISNTTIVTTNAINVIPL